MNARIYLPDALERDARLNPSSKVDVVAECPRCHQVHQLIRAPRRVTTNDYLHLCEACTDEVDGKEVPF